MRAFATALLCCVVFAYSPTGARAQAAAPTPPSAQAAAKANRASAANGKAVFLRIGCQSCHGTVGQGGAGARLAPSTLPFDAFRTWVRSGTPGWTIARGMPAFPASVVTDDELADVRAYLASLPPPPGPDRIPLLRP